MKNWYWYDNASLFIVIVRYKLFSNLRTSHLFQENSDKDEHYVSLWLTWSTMTYNGYDRRTHGLFWQELIMKALAVKGVDLIPFSQAKAFPIPLSNIKKNLYRFFTWFSQKSSASCLPWVWDYTGIFLSPITPFHRKPTLFTFQQDLKKDNIFFTMWFLRLWR